MIDDAPPTKAAALRADRSDHGRGTARRTNTKKLICEAANRLFVEVGFLATTMDLIARAAGIRRSTLYTHFADKEQILAAIGADYVLDVCDVIRRLPGPRPDEVVIAAWLHEFADFVKAQPGPGELITAMGRQGRAAQASIDFGRTMMRCLAERLPAFARALRPGETFQRAWAHATLSEVAAAVLYGINEGQGAMAEARLAVAGMLLARFVQSSEPSCNEDDG